MGMKDNYFVLDSEHLDKVESRLYGFALANQSSTGGRVLHQDEHNSCFSTLDGCYVQLQNLAEEIIVTQDYTGSYGLYLYRSEGYFALSNSLLLLAETMASQGRTLTLNQDYLDAFLLGYYTMKSCLSTPFQEITELMRNTAVRIRKLDKQLQIVEARCEEQSVDLATPEALDILDRWYAKWTSIVHEIGTRGNHLCVDLTAGFDSRLIFLLFLGAKLPKGSYQVASYKSDLHTFAEDYQIASQIVEHYGLELNRSMGIPNFPLTLEDCLASCCYARLWTHKQMGFMDRFLQEPLYHFAGLGGENLRHYEAGNAEYWLSFHRDRQKSIHSEHDFLGGYSRILAKSRGAICRMHPNPKPEEMLGTYLWIEGGNRHHHGREMLTALQTNHYKIGPLLDADLLKLDYHNEYPMLLNALIMLRYEPELMQFQFNKGHEIPEKTISEARRINSMRPMQKHEDIWRQWETLSVERGTCYEPVRQGEAQSTSQEAYKWLQKAYSGNFVKEQVQRIYPESVYAYGQKYYDTHCYFPEEEMCSLIAAAYAVWLADGKKSSNGERMSLMKIVGNGVAAIKH